MFTTCSPQNWRENNKNKHVAPAHNKFNIHTKSSVYSHQRAKHMKNSTMRNCKNNFLQFLLNFPFLRSFRRLFHRKFSQFSVAITILNCTKARIHLFTQNFPGFSIHSQKIVDIFKTFMLPKFYKNLK